MFERKNPIPKLSEQRKREKAKYRDEGLKRNAGYRREQMRYADPLGYLGDLLTGKLPTAKQLGEELKARDQERLRELVAEAKDAARIMMLDDATSYRAGEMEHELPMVEFGAWLEDALREGKLPDTIIAEDVTGRPLAQICRTFLTLLNKRINPDAENVPVISYAVGRYTSPTLAKQLAEGVAQKLEKRGARNVLVCTDAVETGSSMGPLLTEIGGQSYSLALMIDRITPRAETMILERTEKNPAVHISLHPDMDIGQDSVLIMRTLERRYKKNADYRDLLLVIEELENRPYRLQAIEEIATVMYETFLERPGVKELVAGR
ncbi:MAG: hypothetical protein KBD05_00020 [Candidatus Pacebacteria bacterium]|nr:hypothetical protein [Candidatus Paceibacterota bacterium]